MKLYFILTSLLWVFCSFIISGCSGKSSTLAEKSNEWDSVSRVYQLPYNGLEYTIAADSNMIVAEPQNLPEGLDMCALDTANNISVTIINATKAEGIKCPVNKYSPKIIENIAYNISRNGEYSEVIVPGKVTPERFLGGYAWKFDVDKSVIIDADTLNVKYVGYVFDGSSEACVIVLTAPDSISPDSISSITQQYFNKLARIE